jgi:para-nitrobenzyl esterase
MYPDRTGRFGAMHALDLPFTFDNVETARDLVGPLEEAQSLADRIAEAWVSFARDGVPRAKDLPEWPTYSTAQRRTLLFDRDSRVVSDPDGDIRQAWVDVRSGSSSHVA